jgi:hypothetical protein
MLNMLSGHSAAQVICSIYESLPVVLLDLKFPILREVSACPGTPKQSCSALQDFSWRPCSRVGTTRSLCSLDMVALQGSI